MSMKLMRQVMYQSVCKFGVGEEVEEKMAFNVPSGMSWLPWICTEVNLPVRGCLR